VSAARAAAPLDLVTVRRKLREARELLAAAVELLDELYAGQAWKATGHDSWAELCAAELPELARLLSAAERRSLVVDLRQRGMSLRAAAAPAGVSAATAKTWLDDAGVQLATVTSLDGRVRPAKVETVKPRLTNVARAVLVVREAGDAGVTVHELSKRLRLNQCAASALLSRLAGDGRLAYEAPAKRGQTGRYRVGARSSGTI
jgi:transposase